MRELDTLLSRFLEQHYAGLTADEIGHFESILELPDPELYGYLVGGGTHPDSKLAALVERIRNNPGY